MGDFGGQTRNLSALCAFLRRIFARLLKPVVHDLIREYERNRRQRLLGLDFDDSKPPTPAELEGLADAARRTP